MTEPQGARRRVLIVDDDPLQLKLSSARLRDAGYDVTGARSAAEALALAREHPPDAIFSDVLMGETDGFGFCRRLREQPELGHVPVVLASAHYWDERAHALAIRVGASALVGRTPDFDAELRAVSDALERSLNLPQEPDADEYEAHLRMNADQLSRILGEAQEAEGRYRALFENANDAIAVLNTSGVILEVNERWRSVLGVEPRSLTGRHLLDFTPNGRASFGADLESAMRSPGGRVYGVPVQRGDGGTVYIDFSISSITLRDRQLVFAIGRDVTGRFLAAQALAIAEEKYRSLIEHLPDVVLTATLERWMFVTNNVERLTGFSPTEMYTMGRSAWLTRIHPDDDERFEQAFKEFVEHGMARRMDIEYRWRRKDGEWIWIWHRVIASYERNGVRHADMLMSDVTERKRLEESLRQAQKMEAIGQLTGGIAHDFNNILATILANSQFLLDGLGEQDPRTSDAQEVKLAAERAAALTRQLLAFARRQVLEPRVIDLNRVLGNLERMLRRLISEDISLSVKPGAKLGSIRADAGQIEQVVLNLAVNARDAMPGGGQLTIETSNVEIDEEYLATHSTGAPGRYVMLSVSDTGVGMDAATQRRIFEPFFTTKDAGKGTGLGLATCHGIVAQSGGHIGVYSEPGKGTVFKVYLPRVDAIVEVAPPAPSRQVAASAELVLLVEDDPPLRAAVQRMLGSRGYRVLLAKDGREALELAQQHRDDLACVLSDVVMPQISGPDLATKLRETNPRLKVLFMSGYTDHTALHGNVVDKVHFIQKPFTAAALAEKLHETLTYDATSNQV